MSATVSRHFVAEKVKALCVVSDVCYTSATALSKYDVLPAVASGGWDNEINHITLHAPVRPTLDELSLRREFSHEATDGGRPCELKTVAATEHEGGVNALQFVVTRDEKLLVSASSTGGIFAYRVSSSTTADDTAMTDEDADGMLTALAMPQWEQVFAGTAATCVEVSESRTSLVAASADGALAWLRLDEFASVVKIERKDMSRLPINAVKFLGRDSVVASVGSSPAGQLRIWDLAADNQSPIATCPDTRSRSFLTSLETHPTRPELLITGAADGCVSLWDRRKLAAPFRTDTHHHRAVRALKVHSAQPRYLYTGSDDAVVNRWDFHHGRNPSDPVEYERYSGSASSDSQSVVPFDPLVTPSSGQSEELGGLRVQQLTSGSQPWNAVAIHAESDVLVAGSDAQTIMIVQNVSQWQQ
ncbi:unnamed protein product [Hyaloperonospora brassicae]|uniref:Anaphase-promoting complex subunit 4 WD40 domain-containing protein n=1 Tax=Hyaloperonospora brassicae TaxID=162125 RepID=A0AAV0U6D2_HYABA|nr:unnamed protein product [Hyaloperonospora brassicae]